MRVQSYHTSDARQAFSRARVKSIWYRDNGEEQVRYKQSGRMRRGEVAGTQRSGHDNGPLSEAVRRETRQGAIVSRKKKPVAQMPC